MASQLEVFRILAPEFSAESDITVQSFLDLAPLYIDPQIYPTESRGLALVLKAASLMTARGMSQSGASGGGVVTEEKEGDLTRKYSTNSRSKITSDNIYEQQLNALTLGIVGMSVRTRMG